VKYCEVLSGVVLVLQKCHHVVVKAFREHYFETYFVCDELGAGGGFGGLCLFPQVSALSADPLFNVAISFGVAYATNPQRPQPFGHTSPDPALSH